MQAARQLLERVGILSRPPRIPAYDFELQPSQQKAILETIQKNARSARCKLFGVCSRG